MNLFYLLPDLNQIQKLSSRLVAPLVWLLTKN